MRIGIVVPHIFMHRDILPRVIFSPAELAISLANGIQDLGHDVTLLSPGPVDVRCKNITANLSLFETELTDRSDTYIDLLKKHPLTFITLARQVQAELINRAFMLANQDKLDIVHIYTNEEELGVVFADLCTKPVIFTHHDPYNFLVKYKNLMPKYPHRNWLSISMAQRKGMPPGTNWIANIYHGIPADTLVYAEQPRGDYIAFLGRIIEPKGLHLAIQALTQYNAHNAKKLQLRIAGKHYAGHNKDAYWAERISPLLNENIVFDGYISGSEAKSQFLGNAIATIMPSIFDEPFGMVAIESLATGTPVICLDSGALPEIIQNGNTGIIVKKSVLPDASLDEATTASSLSTAIYDISHISRRMCRADFEQRFTIDRMCNQHIEAYERLITE